MVLPNPTHTYKALLLDYDALLLASDEECSFCLSEREIQIMLAFIEYIGWKTRYIATETEIDQSLILDWQNKLARKLMSGCCDDNELHRFTEGGIYQTSDDGGVTWHDDPENDPRNQYVGIPPLPGAPSNAKRCAAADNVRSLFEQYRDNLVSIVGATPFLLEIVAGIVAFIGVLVGVSGVGVGISVLFLTMAAQMIAIGGGGITSEINATVLDTFRCLVYCRMNQDGELTYDAWQGLLTDIADEFSGFAETFFYQTVQGMGYVGVNNAATMGDSTASDCDDCDCPVGCLDASWVVIGTVLAQDATSITVEAVFDAGYGQYMIVYGSNTTGEFCCTIDTEWLVGTPATGWVDCGGGSHSTNPEGELVGEAQYGYGGAPGGQIRFIFP